ncbi:MULTISPECIES: HD domain-containing protein [unclassified Mesorhizobium]|uniref:HD domain-containing protein n=1 Tax=unclassified Mesorhizobium TaxID=325217 RepID=UPI0003CF1BC8|nr:MULTISPECIES: HD domain-containing protein [unclassified Mesorhizobium]ESX84373.1 phosphohydrolase [Mesorhizobium sp. LSHC412B00]ESY02834.1 phosphohydrolase [Mesorhizobium sp. LNJC398B00]
MTKMIKDPIHGSIEFEGESELQLKSMLADPFFQRLRRVKQLGFSDYVFPSAAHSRFAHSLGVYSVAKRMLSVVEPEARNGEWTPKGRACLAAALLHDIGHGMFSHAFESAMELFVERNPQPEDGALQAAVNHEKVGQKIITDSSIAMTLTEMGGPDFPSMVAGMINKADKRCVYTSLVSSQLDADRLDYAKRDPYFAGVSSGGLDLDWLIRNFQVGSGENGQFLYVNSKAYISLEQFTVTLFQLYPTLYLHKRTRGLEYMFSLLMSRVFERFAEGDEKLAGLSSSHPLVRFFRDPERLENALLLDDTLFWGSLHLFQEARDKSISTVADRITSRKFYPMLDVWKLADEVAAKDGTMKGLDAAKRVGVLHKVCEKVSQDLRKKDGLWTEACYYDRYPRPIYKPLGAEGGHPQQINVEVGGKIVDIASISPIVASAASFNIHRIYFDDVDEGLQDRLASEIRSSIRRELAEAAENGFRV